MIKIAECVPNFSTSDEKIIEQLVNAVKSTANVKLVDYSSDDDHGRTVITFAAESEPLLQAAFAVCKTAVQLINLNLHSGVHPRMGAVDVVPFIPLKNMQMKDCVLLSQRLGKMLADELNLPVYLYEYSAKSEARKNLADIRRGNFEGLQSKMKQPEWRPDFGPAVPHPTAGAVAIGARKPLIAFNVNLQTSNVETAKKIAAQIREANGGIKGCKAIGLMLKNKGVAQVSMNIVDFEAAPLLDVYKKIEELAQHYGTQILESELIGAAPAKALIEAGQAALKIKRFNFEKQVLENKALDGLIGF